MASNREERRLQRQRGAQRHQVQDVDFGTPFSATTVPQRVTRSEATPQLELPLQPPNRRTPVTRGRGDASNTRSTRSAQKISTPTPKLAPSDANRSANTSAKRRKLDTSHVAPQSSPARSTRSRPTPHRDIYDLEEEEPATESVERQTLGQTIEGDQGPEEELDQVRQMETPMPHRVTNPSITEANEVIESPRHAPGSSQRQQANLEGTRIPGVRLLEDSGEAISSTEQAGQSANLSPQLAHWRSPRNREASMANEIDELSPDRLNRSRLVFQSEQFSDTEPQEQDEAEPPDVVEAVERLQKKRKRKRKAGRDGMIRKVEVEAERDEDQDQAELSAENIVRPKNAVKLKEPRAIPSPAAQRQPRKSRPKPTSRESRETIPVVVHRLTKSVHYGEDDTDTDLLHEDVPFAKRSGVNAVDVLSQFCEEIIESGLAALEEGGSNTEDPDTRREYRTKLRAVEAFQEELRTKLLELTVTLDTDYLLDKRVRAAQKEKIQLREDLLHLRAEREQLALRMDEVRIKHENSSKEGQEQATLSNSLHDIELAVSRGVEKAPTGGLNEPTPPDMLILLKTVAGEVSSNSYEGGILKRVKEFNAFLERAALALEIRS